MEIYPVINWLSWFTTLIIGIVTCYLVKFYLHVQSMPPGPFPLPIIGNILEFRGKNNCIQKVFSKNSKKYKDMHTIWFGSEPFIVVSNWELCKESLVKRRNKFSGRTTRYILQLLLDGKKGVFSSDYGPCWIALRKTFLLAVKYTSDDPEFIKLKKTEEEFHEKHHASLPCDALPWLAWFYRKRLEDLKKCFDKYFGIMKEKYFTLKILYKRGVVLDFIDAILEAREEAKENNKESLQHLNDGNLPFMLFEFFTVGTHSSKKSILWTLLIICNKPKIQDRIRAEIDEKIGSRMPSQEDKRLCPYTFAVMMETWRFRPVVGATVEHKITSDTELGGYRIPRGTSCLFHTLHNHMDETLWEEPKVFKPERFLDSRGQLITSRPNGYMPFGMGPRECPGEKLAMANIFLILTRLLQKATFELENGPGSVSLNPEYVALSDVATKYKLKVKKRSPP